MNRQRRKGEPLLVLGLVVTVWLGARLAFWTSPFPHVNENESIKVSPDQSVPVAAQDGRSSTMDQNTASAMPTPKLFASVPGRQMFPTLVPPRILQGATPDLEKLAWPLGSNRLPSQVRRVPPASKVVPPVSMGAVVPALSSPSPLEFRRRWRVDGWVLARQGSGSGRLPAAGRPASYGASQAGAVLRYQFGRRGDPELFLRTSRALVQGGETDAALGAAIRPITGVPVAATAEMRVTQTNGRQLIRPAMTVVTELPPMTIGKGVEAEAYAQAGYVAGEFATPFVDGQIRVERRIVSVGGANFHVGVGAWGGAQAGAARADIGPTASLRFDIAKVPVRVSADYRHRIVGNAEPGSGIAVTLSSGF